MNLPDNTPVYDLAATNDTPVYDLPPVVRHEERLTTGGKIPPSGSMSLLDFVAKRAAGEGYIDSKRDGNQTYFRWRSYVLDATTGRKKRGASSYLGNDKTRRFRER